MYRGMYIVSGIYVCLHLLCDVEVDTAWKAILIKYYFSFYVF